LLTQKHLLPTALKAAAKAGIPRGMIVLIGEERDSGVAHFTDILDATPKGARTALVPETDLAFLVYSSGTTGLPKGVMLTHLNVVSDLFMMNSSEGSFLEWNRDKILSVLPFYHIYGMYNHDG
jgi:4-coumarate--CoA ligase